MNKLYQSVSPAIVTLFVEGMEKSVASGYIHAVSNGNLIIATAAHATLYYRNGELVVRVREAFLKGEKKPKDVQEKVVVLGFSANDDIALLNTVSGHFDEKRQRHLCFSEKECRVGDPVVIFGTLQGSVAPQPALGEIRACSNFSELRNTEWTQEVPSIMGTAPVASGPSGSPMMDGDGGVWSIAEWHSSSASTFVGGIHPFFYRRIVERLLKNNAGNIKHPVVDVTTKAGSTLTNLRVWVWTVWTLACATGQRIRSFWFTEPVKF